MLRFSGGQIWHGAIETCVSLMDSIALIIICIHIKSELLVYHDALRYDHLLFQLLFLYRAMSIVPAELE